MPPKKSKPTKPASALSKGPLKAFARPAVQVEEHISETLQSAIFEVDSAYLRTSVLALCKRKYDGTVFNKTLEEWLVKRIANTKAAEEEEDEDDNDQEDEENEALKRWVVDRIGNNKDAEEEHGDEEGDEIKDETDAADEADSNEEEIAELATCKYCNEEFDLLENKSKDCLRHPGRKEVDTHSDFWADHDDDCHGDPEDFIDDEDYAGGFIYSCCQQTGDTPGCKPTRHKASLITESYRPKAGVKRKVSYDPVRSSKAKRVKKEPQW